MEYVFFKKRVKIYAGGVNHAVRITNGCRETMFFLDARLIKKLLNYFKQGIDLAQKTSEHVICHMHNANLFVKKNEQRLDIRIWTKTGSSYKPSRKGFAFGVGSLPALVDILADIDKNRIV